MGDHVVCKQPTANPCLSAYDKYNPIPSRGWKSTPTHLVVVPEVRASLYSMFRPSRVAIWWLAVDNAYHASSKLRDKGFHDQFFADTELIHFCPTQYARTAIGKSGAERPYLLSDYTDDQFTTWRSRQPNKGLGIAYNPKKGAALAAEFFLRHPDLKAQAIAGLTRRDVWCTFRETLLYVDFSHFPGRECMPREAAGSGCTIFIHNRGAAAYYYDYPIPNYYRFSTEDVGSGSLYRRIRAALDEPSVTWNDQAAFRQLVRGEKSVFFKQVADILGR